MLQKISKRTKKKIKSSVTETDLEWVSQWID